MKVHTSSKSVKRSGGGRTFSGDATHYPLSRWPRDQARLREQRDTYLLLVQLESVVTTDGSGILNQVYSNLPSGITNWSSYASVFEEVRVAMFSVAFIPLKAVGGGTTLYWAPIVSVVDRSDATALTGYTVATRFSSCEEHAGMAKFERLCPLEGIEDSGFQSTGTVSATNWIKIYSTGNSATLSVGRMLVELLLQFRGRGIN